MSDDVTKPSKTADDDMRIGGLTKTQADELAAYIIENQARQFADAMADAVERRRDRSPASRDE